MQKNSPEQNHCR